MNLVDTLNNREKALVVWVLLFLIWILFQKEIRRSSVEVLKALFQAKVFPALVAMILYIGLVIWLLYKVQFWSVVLVKDTVLWFVFVGFVLFININTVNQDERYFRKLVVNTLKLTLVIEFIVNFYTFSFIVELILMPILFLVVGASVVADTKEEYKSAKKALDFILGVFGVYLIIFALSSLVQGYQSLATIDNLHAFILPPLLTLALVPFIYFMALIFAYDSLFIRMKIFVKNDENALRYARWKILLLCNLNLKKLNKFVSENHREIMHLRDKDDVMNLIRKLERSGAINWGLVRRWYLRIGVIFIAVLLIAFLLESYSLSWTGFGDFETPAGEFVRGKTLWDWMELALIPLVLSLGALYFSNVQRRTEIERAKRSEQADILQNYFDRMQSLILDRGLLDAEPASPVTTMAMMLTRTTLDRLEPEQKTHALQFLDGTGLTTATHSADLKISLTGASLEGVGLPTSYANGVFFGADFRFANMAGARFDMADFRGADFMGTHLENAKMMYCDFSAANLEGAFLKGANLFGSKFSDQTIMPNGKNWHEDVNWNKLEVVFEDPYTEKEYREALEELDYEV